MTFHVGQKVVCVRDDWSWKPCPSQPIVLPRAGVEYIIRSLATGSQGPMGRFHWMVNPKYQFDDIGFDEPQFAMFGLDGLPNFKPVIDRSTETGMAILREILDRESDKPRKKIKVSS